MSLKAVSVGNHNIYLFIDILNQVNNYALQIGIELWEENELTKDSLLTSNTRCFLFYDNDEVIGTAMLEGIDNKYWYFVDHLSSIYLHKLAVLPQHRNKGYSKKIVNFCKSLAKEENNFYLRLDCLSSIKSLNSFYIENYFEFYGVVVVNGREHSLYQYKLI